MDASSTRRVEITESGRSGSVVYREPASSLAFYWEFGGGGTVAIIQVSDASAWKARPSWAAGRRGEILRFVADEVIRQKAPNCRWEIDEDAGCILLREGARNTPRPPDPGTSWVLRYTKLKMKLGLVVLVVSASAAALFWFKNKVLVIDPGKGTPFGLSVRTDEHIATLIQTLVPYTPSLNRDHSRDEYRMSIFLVPLDGRSPGQLIPVSDELSPSAFRLAKILGSDGRTLWFDANGIGGVELRTDELVTAEDLRKANPALDADWWEDTRGMEVEGRLRITTRDRSRAVEIEPGTLMAAPIDPPRSTAWPFAPAPTSYLCAGLFTAPNEWLGLHSASEVERQFKPKSWLRRVERADDAKEMRLFHRGVLDPDTSTTSHRILTMSPVGKEEYLNAAFLRTDDKSEPLRLSSPAGGLIVYTSASGPKGTLMVARVDTGGTVLWKVDTGIDRFNLSQILPSESAVAFVGPRQMVAGKVSEPLLVIVENASGKVVTHSLWR